MSESKICVQFGQNSPNCHRYYKAISVKKAARIIKNGGIKSCSTCKNNVEYPPPHTCDICTSLDQEEEYEMWKEK